MVKRIDEMTKIIIEEEEYNKRKTDDIMQMILEKASRYIESSQDDESADELNQ